AGLGVAWLWRRRRQEATGLGLFTFGYYLFYAIARPQIFPWYYVPIFFCVLLLMGIGIWGAAHAMLCRLERNLAGRALARRFAYAAVVLLAAWSLVDNAVWRCER